jgi:hypothetical protein
MSIITDQNGNVQFAPLAPQMQPMVQMPTSGLGVLAAQPGLLQMFGQSMPTMPTMPEDKFDPRGALIGGGLMDLADIIMKRTPQNRGMDLYKNARTMYDRDRQLKYQNAMAKYQGEQQNFQNTLGVGQLMATLAKDASPSDIKMMRLMGLDPRKPADQAKFYETVNKGKGTTLINNPAGEGDSYMKALNAALGKQDADFIGAQAGILNSDELAKIGVLESLNDEISSAGFVGDLFSAAQNAVTSMGFDFTIDSEAPMRDLYRQVSNTFVLDEAARQTGALSDGDIILFTSVTANLDQSPQGRKFATQFMKATAQRRRDVAEAFSAWAEQRIADKKPPSKVAWIRSEEFKALKKQSIFDSNPELLSSIYKASTTTTNKKKIRDMRIDQLENQGMNESQIIETMKQEGFL